MAVQLTLDRCGVVLLDRGQGGTVPGPQPQRGPNSATDCGSVSPAVTGGEQSRITGHPHLRISQWNAEGIRNKKMELQNFLKTNNIDICCIQESHLNSMHRFSVRGYETFRQDRENRPKGGVVTLVKNNYSAVEVQRSGDADTEYITVKLILPDRTLTICNLYSPPGKMIQLHDINPTHENFIICGDFNSHSPSWGYQDLDAKGDVVEDWIINNQIVLINMPDDQPTFYSRVWRTTSSPDLSIATDDIHSITSREVCQQLGGSDHRPVILTIQKQVNCNPGKLPPSWNYKKANWDLFMRLSEQYSRNIYSPKAGVDRNASSFTTAVINAAKRAIPRGRRRDYKPFWNPKLDTLHKQLSEAREKMERDPTDQNVARHNQAKKAFEDEKLTMTRKSWHEKTASLNFEKDTQKLWQLTKVLNQDNSQRNKTVLQTDNGIVTGKAAANVFAKEYQAESEVDHPHTRVQEVRIETRQLQHAVREEKIPCMSDNLTLSELEDAIKKLKQKKAPGPDGVTNEMLKHLGPGAKRILLSVFNQSWHSGRVPTKWKEAHIRPIPKKGKDKRQTGSYRPISLLSCVAKLLERIVNRRLMWHVESNKILTSTQTGYRQHHSTEDQLAFLTQDIENAFQEKKKVLAVFFDLSKAFDTVWKEALLLKLLKVGVQGKMYRWLSDYLFQRTARVKLDGTISNLVKLREGVPQGGVISPTLFLVYINDITTTVPKHVSNTLHADDFAVWNASEHTTTATHRIQDTVNRVNSWTEKWALKLNKTKTVSTLFSLSTSKEKVKLNIADQPVPQVETPTFLGVTLDTRLTWKPHLEAVETRTVKRLSLLKKLAGTSWGANSRILRQVYTGAVRPIAEYAAASWTTAAKVHKNKLDRMQNMGLRTILGAMKSTPVKEMEKTADIEPLEKRREYKILAQAEKAKRLSSHPLHRKLQEPTKNRLKRQSLNHVIKDLQRTHDGRLGPSSAESEELFPRVWQPRHSFPMIRTDVPGLTAKGEQTPAQQKALTLEMMDIRYPQSSWIQAFTDGSAENAVRNGGSGVLIKFPGDTPDSLSIPVGDLCSNYRAELEALQAAAKYLTERDDRRRNIVFLTDSLSALQCIMSGPTDHPSKELCDSLQILSQQNNVVLQWIPAHVGIRGNETADQLAKAGSHMPQPHIATSYKEAKTLLKQNFRTDWQNSNNGYSPQHDPINKLEKREQTTIFRLRTGHCGLKKHMKRMGLAENAHCECGSDEQTPEHILQTCPLFEDRRQQTWEEDTPFGTKLWGNVDDLRRTANFVGSLGLTI